MAVIIRNSGNTGALHIIDEATNREFMTFDPTNMTIRIPAGVKVVQENDPPEPPTGTKIPLDTLLGTLLNS